MTEILTIQNILQSQQSFDSFLNTASGSEQIRLKLLAELEKKDNVISELEAHNTQNQHALNEIRNTLKFISEGNFTARMVVDESDTSEDPIITDIKITINLMVNQITSCAGQILKIANEVAHGELGGQIEFKTPIEIDMIKGDWKLLSDSLNLMALNLTNQVREIVEVVRGVADGDLSKKINVHAQGEILELQNIINTMVEQLKTFAFEVTRVSRETGVEGRLGGQAVVVGAEGIWKELTDNVNAMATNLTNQVRNIANVTTAVAKGDLSKKVTADCKGEILDLKSTINQMVDSLQTFATEVTSLATDVGIKGILGGQAVVNGVEGAWKDLTDNVNAMATNLTNQVRAIATVTTAVAHGDLSQKIDVVAQGEIFELKDTINKMVDSLQLFVSEVSRVAKDVGIDGKLGVQAQVSDLDGLWKEIITNVNVMAANLTSQVRAFAQITAAATDGDFTKFITVEASGEMDTLKTKINQMVFNLRDSIKRNTAAREAAEYANNAKSEFLGIFSHELRTPFNGILNYTQLTLETELTQYQREMLSTVHNLANSLLTIIDDILDISKIEANRMSMEEVDFSLRGTVFDALKTVAVKSIEKPLDLIYEVDNSFPDSLVGDPFRLRQVILNLVGNAIKFTSKGHVKLTVKKAILSTNKAIESTIENSHYVIGPTDDNINPPNKENSIILEFCVSDTGIGIAQDKLNLIFETFTQADGSTTRKFGGTGLGLSISKKLIHLMGGEIWVTSVFREGSKFYFTINVTPSKEEFNKTEDSLLSFNQHPVLFVPTQYTSIEAGQIKKDLAELNLVPTVVNDIALIPESERNKFDVIIIDSVQMGRYLRELQDFKNIPYVVLNNHDLTFNMRESLDLGIQSHGNTPCSLYDLAGYLKPALESRAYTPRDDETPQKYTILLAEDNVINQKLAVRILEKHGHEVFVVKNGEEAIDEVKRNSYDVVLMDVQMPIMGGFEATEKIREWEKTINPMNPVSVRTPIIALTAHAMLGDRERCLQHQMDEYISKPLKPNLLIQTMARTIHHLNKLKGLSFSSVNPRSSSNHLGITDKE